MSGPEAGRVHLVVLLDAGDAAPDALATIEAVGPHVHDVTVTGGEPTVADEVVRAAPSGPAVRAAELSAQGALPSWPGAEDAGWVLILRAGDRVRKGAVAAAVRAARDGAVERLVALRPAGVYRLDDAVADLAEILVERDEAATWVGTAGFLAPARLLDRCHCYDLRSGAGPGGLFLEALLHVGRARLVPAAVDCGPALEDALSVQPCLYDPGWYHGLTEYFHRLRAEALRLHGELPRYFQHAYVYLLNLRFAANRNAANKMVLRADLPQFLAAAGALLRSCDVSVVLDPLHVTDFRTRLYLLELTGPDAPRPEPRYYSSEIALVAGDVPVANASDTLVEIEYQRLTGDRLAISGRYRFPVEPGTAELVAEYRGRCYPVTTTGRRTSTNAFGVELYRDLAFDVTVPLRGDRPRAIRFYLQAEQHGTRVPLELRFRRPRARLTRGKAMYWAEGRYLLYYRTARIVVAPNTVARRRAMERKYLRVLLFSREREHIGYGLLRLLYLLSRFHYRKRVIWIYFDKLYKAGDNGEYAYRYAAGQRDGIDKYYILHPDSTEVSRFKAEGVKFVRYHSVRQRLLFLNASVVFTTHINPQNFGGFHGYAERYFRGLFRYRLVCIQHGLSVQDLASSLNRVYDGMDAFCLASPVERENLSLPAYDYRPEQLELTGLARYDGLRGEPQRQLLIAPTWRTYLAAPYDMGRARGYSAAFRDSDYRRLYQALITDERLLSAARAAGYRIVLLLHPVTSSQLADFTAGEGVEVVASTGEFSYERALIESSLMVTDYSGIQFDFASMYKPVVYFHPPELPPSYDQGAYRYETMALGEICTSVDDLVRTLCGYLERDCALREEYRTRIDAFFAHHDHDNAARIYQLGLRLQGVTPRRAVSPGPRH